MNFKGDFRAWFEGTFKHGDEFRLQIESGETDALRFLVPATGVVEERLPNNCVLAVRPDWTDNRGLLGYFNPLTEQYSVTPLLMLLLRAHEEGNQNHPFFAVLDEMNLARVEHYFSDFLSCLESGRALHLHDSEAVEEGEHGQAVPRDLTIPANLYITGTVNIDETTYMFSPKVLDRAFTIELSDVDLAGFGAVNEDGGVDTELSIGQFGGLDIAPGQPSIGDWKALAAIDGGALKQQLVQLNQLLTRWQRHFGYRVATEIARFVNLAFQQSNASTEAARAAFDLALLEKILPKFHGTQQELEKPLQAFFGFAITGLPWSETIHLTDWQVLAGKLSWCGAVEDAEPQARLPRTAAKVWRMLLRLEQQGFTSFIE